MFERTHMSKRNRWCQWQSKAKRPQRVNSQNISYHWWSWQSPTAKKMQPKIKLFEFSIIFRIQRFYEHLLWIAKTPFDKITGGTIFKSNNFCNNSFLNVMSDKNPVSNFVNTLNKIVSVLCEWLRNNFRKFISTNYLIYRRLSFSSYGNQLICNANK